MEKFMRMAVVLFFLLAMPNPSGAKEILLKNNKNSPEKSKPGKSAVVELDAELIEGETRRPLLFLEFDKHTPTMDSIIFQRLDFNDFRKVNSNIYLKYLRPRK